MLAAAISALALQEPLIIELICNKSVKDLVKEFQRLTAHAADPNMIFFVHMPMTRASRPTPGTPRDPPSETPRDPSGTPPGTPLRDPPGAPSRGPSVLVLFWYM